MSEVISKPTGVRQIARQLSLSICTVSKALNQRPGVSEKTRRRVMIAAEDLGYVPNQQARMLSNGRTRTIALLLPTLANPVYSENMQDIYKAAKERNYEILVTSYEWDHQRRMELCREMIGRRVEGVILHGGPDTTPLSALCSAGISVLYINPLEDHIAGAGVLKVDRSRGAGLLLRHLFQLGHRRPLLLGNWHTNKGRIEGIRAALAEVGRPMDEFIVAPDFPDKQYIRRGHESTLELFQSNRHAATAIMGHNDQVAIGAISALHQLGLSVPGDVSVTGMDNITAGEFAIPPLTTDSVRHLNLGRQAVSMLINMIEGKIPSGSNKILTSCLVARQSTGPAALRHRADPNMNLNHSDQERVLSCSI